MLITILLWIILIFVIIAIRPPNHVREFKERYKKLRSILPDKYKKLRKPIPITIFSSSDGKVGYNVNKGSEIGICSDGTTNQMMHVLLHELAHVTVDEYDHSPAYWSNFAELREIAQSHGLYVYIPTMVEYCGREIRD